jgi:hypothetical protein
MFVTGAAAVAYRGRREQGMEIRCHAASVGDEFPWCKTPGKDVVVDQKTIARDVGFFLVFSPWQRPPESSSCPCS